jgi:hypothetical protein
MKKMSSTIAEMKLSQLRVRRGEAVAELGRRRRWRAGPLGKLPGRVELEPAGGSDKSHCTTRERIKKHRGIQQARVESKLYLIFARGGEVERWRRDDVVRVKKAVDLGGENTVTKTITNNFSLNGVVDQIE